MRAPLSRVSIKKHIETAYQRYLRACEAYQHWAQKGEQASVPETAHTEAMLRKTLEAAESEWRHALDQGRLQAQALGEELRHRLELQRSRPRWRVFTPSGLSNTLRIFVLKRALRDWNETLRPFIRMESGAHRKQMVSTDLARGFVLSRSDVIALSCAAAVIVVLIFGTYYWVYARHAVVATVDLSHFSQGKIAVRFHNTGLTRILLHLPWSDQEIYTRSDVSVRLAVARDPNDRFQYFSSATEVWYVNDRPLQAPIQVAIEPRLFREVMLDVRRIARLVPGARVMRVECVQGNTVVKTQVVDLPETS
jgi:hypothetical protein